MFNDYLRVYLTQTITSRHIVSSQISWFALYFARIQVISEGLCGVKIQLCFFLMAQVIYLLCYLRFCCDNSIVFVCGNCLKMVKGCATQWMLVKVANLESMVLVSQTVQPSLGILSFFDTDFFSQIKLTKLTLIQCFKPFIRKKL